MFQSTKNLIREFKDFFRFLSAANGQKDGKVIFYSEKDIYYQYFEHYIDLLSRKSNQSIYYLTSDPKDKIFQNKNPGIKSFYIKRLLPTLISQLGYDTLIMTMPEIQRLGIKLKNKKFHLIYIFHAILSTHMIYKADAFDFYDTIFCVGPHHVEEIRAREKHYRLKAKDLIEAGYPLIEKIKKEYYSKPKKSFISRVIIAPTWGPSSILETCIEKIIDALKNTQFEVYLRPHPEFMKRSAGKWKKLKQTVANTNNFKIDDDLSSNTNIYESDILITDWSGIAFEYAFGTGRPVIFIETPRKINNIDYEELKITPFEIKFRNLIGKTVKIDDLYRIASISNEDNHLEIRNYQLFETQSSIINIITQNK